MESLRVTPIFRYFLLFIFIIFTHAGIAQEMPEVLDTGTVEEQFNYLDERTRIYNNFRAIREDMFQKIRTNSNDSLDLQKGIVTGLREDLRQHDEQISQLQENLSNTNAELETAIKNRDQIKFLGIPMHKALYNTILWGIVAALAFITIVLFLSNKRLMTTSRRNKNDLEELREEHEAYRKKTREEREQLVVKHHNEVRKLKGS